MSTYSISKSSLLSLKAEINRKQEELSKFKLQNKIKIAQLKKPLEIKNKGVEQRKLNDVNEEDADLLKQSRLALESKTKLYEKLSRRSNFTDEEIDFNRRFLVRFEKKRIRQNDLPPESDDEMDYNRHPSDEDHFSDEYEPPANPDEEWVEYTDCLGRTRKCMRKDLEYLKSKDADLRSTSDKNRNNDDSSSRKTYERSKKTSEHEEKCLEEFNENSELLSNDMRRELLRKQWEEEEEELRNKDDIHYQDILFNEARMHGVGYYGFSKDEEVRAKQQEALKNLRRETQQKQQKAEELRKQREVQLAARVKAARDRRRARMGLPPEEEEPAIEQPEECTDKEKDESKELEEDREQEKEIARKKHVRPWDIGKKGVREHYELSQDEWNEKKRKERQVEFAPPSSYNRSFRAEPNDEVHYSTISKNLHFSTKKQNKKDDVTVLLDTSRPSPPARKHYNSYKTKETISYEQPTPVMEKPIEIINECESSDETEDRLFSDYQKIQENKTIRSDESDTERNNTKSNYAEIAPPPTYDYYGPSNTKKRRDTPRNGNIEDSISAGLKFLRQQAEKKGTSSKRSSEMFIL